jgi:predicted transcriptional regulator
MSGLRSSGVQIAVDILKALRYESESNASLVHVTGREYRVIERALGILVEEGLVVRENEPPRPYVYKLSHRWSDGA